MLILTENRREDKIDTFQIFLGTKLQPFESGRNFKDEKCI